MRLVFSHKVADGVDRLKHYGMLTAYLDVTCSGFQTGLEMAKTVALPQSMIARAQEIVADLDALEDEARKDTKHTRLVARKREVLKVRARRQCFGRG